MLFILEKEGCSIKMKKKILLTLAVCAALLLTCLPVSAAETYTFGSAKADWKQDEWGKDGWYSMFTQEYNTGGVYDTTKFRDCIWGSKSAFAMYKTDQGRKMWCPSIGAKDTGKFKNDTMWWIISNESGSMMPSNGVSCVLKWEAPKNGKYHIKTTLFAGVSQAYYDHQEEYGSFPMNDDMDGITCSVYQGSKKLFSKNSGAKIFYKDNDLKVPEYNVELKKGEAMYFIADQNEKASYDDSRWTITITKTGDLPADSVVSNSKPAETSSAKQTDKPVASQSAAPSSNNLKPVESVPNNGSTAPSVSESSPTDIVDVSSAAQDEIADSSQLTENTNGDKGSSFPIVPIIIVIIVVVLAAAAVIVFVLMKKKRV